MENYISFKEYKEYGGTIQDESTFNLYRRKAQRKLDYFTSDQVKYLSKIPDEVKELLTDFIDKIQSYEMNTQNLDANVTSYSNGVETMSYSQVEKGTRTDLFNNELLVMMKEYLPSYLTGRSVIQIERNNNNPK